VSRLAQSFTRYPDTAALSDGEKKKVAPGFNMILNGVEKEKVSDKPDEVFVATKMWKAALLSPSPGSVIMIDTPVVVFAGLVGRKT
jgi:hypothetical protein